MLANPLWGQELVTHSLKRHKGEDEGGRDEGGRDEEVRVADGPLVL